jgi:SAM-dependent methyltransferase
LVETGSFGPGNDREYDKLSGGIQRSIFQFGNPMPSHSLFTACTDFERHKDTYRQEIQKSISFIGQDLDFFTQAKAEWLLELTRRYLGNPSRLKVLDVGCGVGITDHYLTGHFGKVHGLDLSPGVVRKAKRLNPKASYRHYGGQTLPYRSNSMDVTFAICVMHHVASEELSRFASELARVTKKGGLIAVFEHNPLNPLTQIAVSRCEMDNDAILLGMGKVKGLLKGGGKVVEKKYILFTPFRAPFFRLLDRFLGWLPLGAQYFVAAIK